MTEVTEFATFVRAHSTVLLRSAFLLTGDLAAAEDLVQDTFTRLFPRWSAVMAADVPLAYVRRSMTNTFLNGRRRSAKHEVLFAEPPERGYDHDLAGPLSDRQLVRGLLAGLSPKQRAVLVLRFYSDLSDAQIAADLGCRQSTVRSIISRGLGALRAEAQRRPPRPRDASPTNGNLR
jgi:RNA polymerase sigma-70 factor (sigma-E family)